MLWGCDFLPDAGLSRKVLSPCLSLGIIPSLALWLLPSRFREPLPLDHCPQDRPVGCLGAAVVLFKHWSCPEPPRATGTAGKGFQHLHPGIFRALGLSPVHSHPWCPNSLGGGGGCPQSSCPARSWWGCFPVPTLPRLLEGSPTALSCSRALMFAAFLSYWGPHFPSFITSAKTEASVHTSLKNGHQLLYGPLPPKAFNLNWLNRFSKREIKTG